MRHLTQSLSALKSNASSTAQTPSYDGSVLGSGMSSPDSMLASGYAIPATSGRKRKIGADDRHVDQNYRASRRSSVQSRSSDDRSPAGSTSFKDRAEHRLIISYSRVFPSRIGMREV